MWNYYSLAKKNVGWPAFLITEKILQEFIKEIGDSQGAVGYFKNIVLFKFMCIVLSNGS